MAVLPHEFGRSFMAWATGIKADPWNIEWGDGSVGDVLLLRSIDENVDYRTALTDGHPAAIAATVMAGPGMNALMFLFVRFAAPLWHTSSRIVIAYLTFWFLFMNIANLYDYVPIRVAAANGDVWQWIQATHMSLWWICSIVGALVLWVVVDLPNSFATIAGCQRDRRASPANPVAHSQSGAALRRRVHRSATTRRSRPPIPRRSSPAATAPGSPERPH